MPNHINANFLRQQALALYYTSNGRRTGRTWLQSLREVLGVTDPMEIDMYH